MSLPLLTPEKLEYMLSVFDTKEKRAQLHPIDRLLLVNGRNSFISMKWYGMLDAMGIDYTTPCMWIKHGREWDRQLNSINSTALLVADGAFLIASNNEILKRYGKMPNAPEIEKDKEHIKSGRLIFTHKITRKEYMDRVIGII